MDFGASRFVNDTIEHNPVVMFALEWCEFCWSVRKLFGRCGIPFHSVDLDSVAFQEDDRGGRIRAAQIVQPGMTPPSSGS